MRYRVSISYQDDNYLSVSHPKIIKAYQYLQLHYNDLLKQLDHVTIRTNGTDVWINFVGQIENHSVARLEQLPFNIYHNNMLIKGLEYVEEKFELDSSHSIVQKQHPPTFFQSDQTIRLFIYNYINKHYSHLDKIALFGGEFYLFSQLFTKSDSNNIICFTDSEDLYNDSLHNDLNLSVNLIDYNNCVLPLIPNTDIIIIQVGPNGLKPNLLKQIIRLQTKHIIYIGCKEDIVDRDIRFFDTQVKFYENFDNYVFFVDMIPTNGYQKEEPKKLINLISAGGECSVAYQLNKFGYRTEAYPFDWLKSDLNDICNLIRNGFKQFLDENQIFFKRSSENYKFIMSESLEDRKETNVDITCGFIYHHKKYKSIEFCHDFVDDIQSNLVEVKEKYKRRIERFQKTLYNRLCILIRYETKKLDDTILLKWEEDVALPLLIITNNPKNQKYVDQQKFGKYIIFIEDKSKYELWQRNNFHWEETFQNCFNLLSAT